MKLSVMITILALGFVSAAQAAEPSFGKCIKGDAEVRTKGKDEKEQAKDCEKQGGKWEKKKADAAKPQESGSGGGW